MVTEELIQEAADWYDGLDPLQMAAFAEWSRWKYGIDVMEMTEEEFATAYAGWMEPPFDI